jgi:hypothetical protein
MSERQTEFLAMTGLSLEEFNALLPAFKKAASESKVTIAGKTRKRKTVIYKNSPISSEADQLLFILIYMKQYMSQTALGILFGINQPKANMLIPDVTQRKFVVAHEKRNELLSGRAWISGRSDSSLF